MQVSNDNTHHPIFDADLHDALVDEREDIEESRALPKWLVQTLCDSKLDVPLSSRTCSGSHNASYVSISMHWLFLVCVMNLSLLLLMRQKIQNIGWLLCNQNMMLLCRMVHGLYVTSFLRARKPLALNGCIS